MTPGLRFEEVYSRNVNCSVIAATTSYWKGGSQPMRSVFKMVHYVV